IYENVLNGSDDEEEEDDEGADVVVNVVSKAYVGAMAPSVYRHEGAANRPTSRVGARTSFIDGEPKSVVVRISDETPDYREPSKAFIRFFKEDNGLPITKEDDDEEGQEPEENAEREFATVATNSNNKQDEK